MVKLASKISNGVNSKSINLSNLQDIKTNLSNSIKNKTSGEEFKIANLFRHACAGIIGVLNDPTGKNPVIQYDDEVANLVGTRINALFVKKPSSTDGKEYSEVYDMVPVAQETEHLTYTEDDVARMKVRVEKRQSAIKNTNNNVVSTVTTDTTTTTTAGTDAEIPF